MILVLMCGLAIACCVGSGAPMPLTSGPLAIVADSDTGALREITVGGQRCGGDDGVARSGFAIADWAAGGEFVPVPCSVSPDGDGWLFAGEAASVKLTARFAQTDAGLGPVRVHVADTSGQGRAISLRFALPIDPDGWSLSRSLDRRVSIVRGVHYDNASSCPIGSGKLDLWPVTAISRDDVTLALSVPLDEPCIYHVACDAADGCLYIAFDLALAALTQGRPREAEVSFAVHGLDNGWGLRAALEAYYRLHPHLFERRTDRGGGWFAWGDILAIGPPICDFGLAFHEGPATTEAKAHNRALGILTFPYIEPGMFQLHFGDFDHRPSREEIMERLESYAEEADAESAASQSADPYGNVKQMCRAILRSGCRDPDGELVIGAIGQYPWVAGSRWAAQFPLVLDPDIAGGAADLYLQWAASNVPSDEWGDGQYLDSYSAHVTRLDYDPSHLALAEQPLCFDPQTLAPCQLMAIPMFEYVDKLLEQLAPLGKLILVNAYGHNAPFPFHQFDVLGKEHWISPSGRLFERYRAMAYHKPVTDLPSSEAADEAFLEECLVYNVFPGGYGRGEWGQQGMRPTYRRVVPLLRLLDRLGWQPVPWARSSAIEAKVERYGPVRETAALVCYAIYNPYAPQVIDLRISRRETGIPRRAWCVELLRDRPLSWEEDGDALTVSLGLGPRETALVAIGDAAAQRTLLRWLAEDRRADAKLCAVEWQLREGQEHPLRARLDDEGADAPALRRMAGEITEPAHPIDARMAELLTTAADLLERAADLSPRRPQAVEAPETQPAGAKLPWRETFDTLDPTRWVLGEEHPGIEVKDGELLLTLPGDVKSVALRSTEPFDFGARPLAFRFRFQYNHAGHQWYLMQSFQLMPTASGGSDDFIHVRMDPRVNVRVENGEAPATNWQRTLTDWVSFAPNEPHEAVLRMDKSSFRLTIDGKDCGSGAHELRFGLGYIHLGLYSGHGGHGDVCSCDEIEVREASDD
jgi:hypothetical protein